MRIGIALALVLAASVPSPVAAATSVAPPATRDFCPAIVRELLAVDATSLPPGRGPAKHFGLVLLARERTPERIYRLAFATDARVYRIDIPVRFDRLRDDGRVGSFSSPAFVAFPSAVTVRDAWVDAVTADGATASCGPNNVDTDRIGTPRARLPLGNDARDALARRIAATYGSTLPSAIDESASAPNVAASCSLPDAAARTVAVEAPGRPEGSAGHTVEVDVSLDADSNVVDARIVRSDANPATEAEALRATYASRFRTERFRCAPIPGTFAFVLEFR